MKKFIIPDVRSTELAQTDVIMVSTLAVGHNVSYANAYSVTTEEVNHDYDIWKGNQKN